MLPSVFRKILGRTKRFIFKFLPTKYRFTKIYNTGSWGCDESVSGGGSTLDVTESIRRDMPGLIKKYEIDSMLDAPCGDFNWMSHMLKDAPDELKYFGADIVTPLIDSIKQHETDNVSFLVADLINDKLPEVKMILCRDCFIHLSEKDINTAIANFKRSGATYLLTTSFSEINEYKDIETGKWRQVNFLIPPFSFPAPLEVLQEQGANGKHLGLWDLNKL